MSVVNHFMMSSVKSLAMTDARVRRPMAIGLNRTMISESNCVSCMKIYPKIIPCKPIEANMSHGLVIVTIAAHLVVVNIASMSFVTLYSW